MPNRVTTYYWQDLAEDRAEGVHNPKLYLGAGLVGGLVLGTVLNPVTAVLALAWGLYCAWDANERNSDQLEAVDDGLVAHLLERKQLRQYRAEVGTAQVVRELQAARLRELQLTAAAEQLAKQLGLETGKPLALPAPSADASGKEKADDSDGTKDQLWHAEASPVRVPASTAPPPHASPRQPASQPVAAPTIAEDMGAQIQNALLIGKPGSGKGIVLSNALRAVQAQHPERTLYVIDPKGDPLEQSYWSGCDCVASKACAGLMPLDIWDWVHACIREFQLIDGPKLLVVDECRFLSNTFARINHRPVKALDHFWYIIESFTSLGDARRSHVWAVSQSSHTADLKISGGTLGQFRVIALVNATADFGFYDTLCGTQIVNNHPDPEHLRQGIAGRSPVGRVYYDSKYRQWFPLPALPNHSGRDRDQGIEDNDVIVAPVESFSPDDIEPQPSQQPTETPKPSSSEFSLEDRVILYLNDKGKFLPGHQIKSAIKALKDKSADDARTILNRMVNQGLIARKIKGVSVLYGPIVT